MHKPESNIPKTERLVFITVVSFERQLFKFHYQTVRMSIGDPEPKLQRLKCSTGGTVSFNRLTVTLVDSD